ncbi:MoaD/ThiS family protein [Thermodesulfobacteriota bacterium]
MIRVNGEKHPWREGMTIEDLLKELENSHHYVVIRINAKHFSKPYFGKTLIPDNAEVFLLPMIAGG